MKSFNEYIKESLDYNIGPVYHGTNNEFKSFKQMMGRTVTIFGSEPIERIGFFFTPRKEAAKEFGDKIITAYLSLHNPVNFTTNAGNVVIQKLVSMGWNENWFYKSETWELFDGQDGAELVKTLKKLGYDGAIIDEPNAGVGRGGLTYVVFDNSQIKIIDKD